MGKISVMIGCENRGKKAGFIAMESVLSINHQTVRGFAKRYLTTTAIFFRKFAFQSVYFLDDLYTDPSIMSI